jgi:hypothetical protein
MVHQTLSSYKEHCNILFLEHNKYKTEVLTTYYFKPLKQLNFKNVLIWIFSITTYDLSSCNRPLIPVQHGRLQPQK